LSISLFAPALTLVLSTRIPISTIAITGNADKTRRIHLPIRSAVLSWGYARGDTWRAHASSAEDPEKLRTDILAKMRALKARAKNGRLPIDGPADLPEADDCAMLHASLDRALDDSEAGRGMDAMEFLRRYRARLLLRAQ
jgi:hypothetical protein